MSARATRRPASPPGEASPPSGRFLLGNLVCEVTSADERYPRLLVAVYSAALLADAGGPGWAPDLRISVRDAPRPATAPSGDRLIVRRDAGAVVLESDPMTWHVRTDVHPFRIAVGIHDPGLREDLLAYHFWILLNRALLLVGRTVLHAAALAYRGSVSLFAGPKGAGKSTIAVALARAGAELLADDHVVARRADGRLAVSGCNGRLRVTAKTEDHFLKGVLDPGTLDVAGVSKKEFAADRLFVARPHQERMVDRLLLTRVGHRFAVRPARRQAALLRLVQDASTMLRFHDRADHADLLTALGDLVALVPCFDLELSPRLADLDCLVEFLEREV